MSINLILIFDPPVRIVNGGFDLGRRASMILCLCSAISDRHVRQAAAAGVTAWQEVFRRQQAAPNCGACVDMICEILDSEGCASADGGACRQCG